MEMFTFLAISLLSATGGVAGSSLSCYKCGQISSDFSKIEDCVRNETTLIDCKEGEVCVTYKQHYKHAPEPVRGCWPINQPLPLVSADPSLVSPVCEFQETEHVSACLCDSPQCNAPTNQLRRQPKQIIFPTEAAPVRQGRQGSSSGRLKCYSCGSLFDRSKPQCDEFNPDDNSQVGTCGPGQACMLYTWKKSSKEIGSYRECFSTAIQLGQDSFPINPLPTCKLSRTQADPRSSIRACMCTQDFCNIVDDDELWGLWQQEENGKAQNSNNALDKPKKDKIILGNNVPKCPVVIVKNADFADCNGEYRYSYSLKVDWAPDRPVYIHKDKDRVLFWNSGGLGWSIGKANYLESGNHWHRSSLDTDEPWQGEWEGGVEVSCIDDKTSDACQYGPYGDWTRCSASCGVGTQTRVRRVTQGGNRCGDTRDSRPCQAAPCPVDCEWGGWGSWSTCSQSCGAGVQLRRRNVLTRASSGGSCEQSDGIDERTCAVSECLAEDCCLTIEVRSGGRARLDQALYMGVYTRLSREYNGRPAYKKMEGHEPLYVYYFTSHRDGISLWVIGPQLGQFIAGIRNSRLGECVHDLRSGWTYASREGVWEDNDPSLSVTCHDRNQTVVTTTTRSPFRRTTRRLTTRRPTTTTEKTTTTRRTTTTTRRTTTTTRRTTTTTRRTTTTTRKTTTTTRSTTTTRRTTTTQRSTTEFSVDCEWGQWGSWSECSESCDGGEMIRERGYAVRAQGAGRDCPGGNRERRRCNQKRCPRITTIPTTTRRTTTTTRRTTTTTRRTTTTTRRTTTTTRRTTTTTRRTTSTTNAPTTTEATSTISAIIVDVKPTSIKCWSCGSLFSTDAPDCDAFNTRDPAQMKTCDPGEACLYYSWKKSATETSVIRECFPTSILLGSIDNPVEPGTQCSPSSIESDSISACICTNDLCNGIGDDDINQEVSGVPITTVRPVTTTSLAPRRTTTERPRETSVRGRVKCHQCGSLFAGSSSNPDCDVFMEDDPLQESYCAAGEVCLWYSWQKSKNSRSFIRQCFSPSIVLGSPDTPLVPRSKCSPQYVSDSNQISACLCNTDLCNSYRSPDETRPDVLPVRTVPQARPIPVSGSNQPEPPRRRKFSSPQQSSNTIENAIFDVSASDSSETRRTSKPKQTFHADLPGLQCYSCGSLLNPNKKCDEFSRTDKRQVQTCLKDEACLMYSWKKSPTETATLRECFPTRVLLGTIRDPLVPLPDCSQRDITDDSSGSIFACLCNTDFCNDAGNAISTGRSRQSSSSASRQSSSTPARELPRQSPVRQSSVRKIKQCPDDFDLVDGECYFLSTERVGWIEARKKCEVRNAALISFDSDLKRTKLSEYVSSSNRRRRAEYWTSGNDIAREGVWQWAEQGARVSSRGWLESPYTSLEENCLVWSVVRGRNGWQGSSCCNNIGYICELL